MYTYILYDSICTLCNIVGLIMLRWTSVAAALNAQLVLADKRARHI